MSTVTFTPQPDAANAIGTLTAHHHGFMAYVHRSPVHEGVLWRVCNERTRIVVGRGVGEGYNISAAEAANLLGEASGVPVTAFEVDRG